MIFDPTSSDLHLIWRTFIDFERFTREPDRDLNYFIEEWKVRMANAQSAGCQYSDLLLGLKLMEKVNLSQDSIVSVISKLSSSTSVSESFLTQVVTNIKEQSEINRSENQSLELANIIKTDVDDQKILEELNVKSNWIFCSKCAVKFSDIESLSKHLHEFHPDMTNDKSIDSKWGIRSDLDYLKSPICDKNLMVKETLKKNLNYKDFSVEQAWVDSSEVDAVSQMDVATLTPDVKIEIKMETSTEPEVGKRTGKRFRCEICSKEFPALWKVKRHMSVHRTAKPFKCRYCDMSSKCLDSLKSHVKRAHLEEHGKQKILKSSVIQDGMDTSERFLEIQTQENSSLRNSSFDQVSVGSSEIDLEVRKEETLSETQDECPKPKSKKNSNKVFRCKICQKIWKNSALLRKHMETHKTTRDYVCSYCGKNYKTLNTFKEHLNLHTKERPLPCNFCGKIFFDHSNRRFHIRRYHTGEKPYKCDFCDRRFFTSSKKNCHMRTHTGEKPFTCQVCGKCFRETTTLKRHVRNVHKIVNSNSN